MDKRYVCKDCKNPTPSVSKRGLCLTCSVSLMAAATRASLEVYAKFPNLLAKELKELEL